MKKEILSLRRMIEVFMEDRREGNQKEDQIQIEKEVEEQKQILDDVRREIEEERN